jgi:hypothetical protein
MGWREQAAAKAVPQVAPPPVGGSSWRDQAAAKIAAPAPVPQAPPEVLRPGMGAGYGDIAKASFADSIPEAIHFYARQMYPNEDVNTAVQKFGSKDGEIYHVPDPSKPNEAYAVAPGFTKGAMTGVGKMLPIGAGVTTAIATLPLTATGVGAAGSMALTAGAGALAETGRQKAGDWLMDSPDRFRGVNTGQVGREALYAGAGSVPGRISTKIAERHAARDIARMSGVETQQAYREAAADGIPITAPEATGLPSLLATQKRLSQRVETTDKAAAFYEDRQGFIADAWDKLLTKVHPSADIDAIGRNAKDAAGRIIEGVTAKRSAAASESYGKVVKPGNEVNGLTLDPYVKKTMDELRTDPLTGRALANLPDNDIVVIDAVGKELRTQMKAAEKAGDNYRAGILKNLRSNLIGEGSLVDDMYPAYRTARTEFANLSREVENMTGSIITAISKIKDTELMKVGMEVLNPARRSPQLITKARAQISKESPEAWDGIVKAMMHTESRAASKETATGMSLGGKLYYKFFGDKFMRDNIRAGMGGGMAPRFVHFKRFMDTLKRTSKVKPFGSDTAMNQEANRLAEEKAAGWVGKTLKVAGTPQQWGRMADDWLTARRLSKSDEKMAELIFDRASDPSVIKAMKELRKVTPGSQRFRMLLGHALTRVAEQGEQELGFFTEDDVQPRPLAPPLR